LEFLVASRYIVGPITHYLNKANKLIMCSILIVQLKVITVIFRIENQTSFAI